MILPFNSPPSTQSMPCWGVFILSYGPSHIAWRRKKINSEMQGVSQPGTTIFKKIEPSADYNIIWSFILESSLPAVYSTKDIFLEKTAFRKTKGLLTWITKGPTFPSCSRKPVVEPEHFSLSRPQTFRLRHQL